MCKFILSIFKKCRALHKKWLSGNTRFHIHIFDTMVIYCLTLMYFKSNEFNMNDGLGKLTVYHLHLANIKVSFFCFVYIVIQSFFWSIINIIFFLIGMKRVLFNSFLNLKMHFSLFFHLIP